MKIGTFTQTEDGYAGTLRTLELNVKVKLVTADKKTNNSPDFRVPRRHPGDRRRLEEVERGSHLPLADSRRPMLCGSDLSDSHRK